MTAFLKTVTVTGADNSVTPIDLLQVAQEYPFVEFGFLLSGNLASRSSSGRKRFPSMYWLRNAVDVLAGKVRCSGHLCGAWVGDILMGRWPKWEFFEIHEQLLTLFPRFQINTHGVAHEYHWPRLRFVLRELTERGHEVIFQYDKANTEVVRRAVDAGFKVSALYDLSHGAGVVPERWERPAVACPIGYAGGLSPANVVDHIARISEVAGGGPTWIDAETHLRSDSDRQFDLGKVRAFLEAAKPWVIQ